MGKQAKQLENNQSSSSSSKNLHSATRPLHVEVSRKAPKNNSSNINSNNNSIHDNIINGTSSLSGASNHQLRQGYLSSVSAPAQIEWIDESDPKMNDDKKYCICKNISYGNMIRCDNVQCEKGEWF